METPTWKGALLIWKKAITGRPARIVTRSWSCTERIIFLGIMDYLGMIMNYLGISIIGG
jgi:hypothetical protein